jgi:hypothetical protein
VLRDEVMFSEIACRKLMTYMSVARE